MKGLEPDVVQRIVEMQDKALAHIVKLGKKAESAMERRRRYGR